MIQRDYVQGREDSKATQIREGFVKSIISALENEKPLHLEFIYGKINGKLDSYKVETNKKAILSLLKSVQDYSDNLDIGFNYTIKKHKDVSESNTYFIPLDGQQRLTTLYLFHWYFCNRIGLDSKDILSRFSYKTRRSSKDFCSGLIKHKVELSEAERLSSLIKDSTWFYNYWKKDPTVRSMLKMLDEIHDNLKLVGNETLEKYWSRITEKEIITFEFLDLDKFELTDELYVKMNARGKSLSDFENFKSWLQAFVKKNEWTIESNDWHNHLDIEWTDIFWKYKESGTYTIDNQYLSFFKSMLLNQFAENVEVKTGKIEDKSKETIDTLRSNDFLPTKYIEQLSSFNQDNLNDTLKILSSLQGEGACVLSDIIERLVTTKFPDPLDNLLSINNSGINLWDRTYNYALTKYLIIKNKNVRDYDDTEKEQLFQWLRVCRNLIFNVAIDSPSDFVQAVKQIAQLSEHLSVSEDFYTFFEEEKRVNSVSFFSKNQIIEEEFKANAVLNDPLWIDDFIKYENHEYFNGSIRFMMHFSEEDGKYYIDKFREYAGKASQLFDSKILNHKNFILQRALLVKGDYLIKVGQNKSFCLSSTGTLRLREENWRKIFNGIEKRKILRELLEEIKSDDVEASLLKIISESDVPKDDWRHYFISTSATIRYAKQMQIRFWDKNIYILNASGSCKNVELYSYWHYLKSIKSIPSDYISVVGYNEEPFEQIKVKIKRTVITLDFNRNHQSGQFDVEINADKKISTQLKDFFKNKKVSFFEHKYVKQFKSLGAFDSFLKQLVNLN